MSEDDLKFFNARTEALKKVEALNKKDDWLKKTTTRVLRNTAEKQMQAISDAVANKYISGPIVKNIGNLKKAADAASDATKKN